MDKPNDKHDKRDESTNSNRSRNPSNDGYGRMKENDSVEGHDRVLPPHNALEALVYHKQQ